MLSIEVNALDQFNAVVEHHDQEPEELEGPVPPVRQLIFFDSMTHLQPVTISYDFVTLFSALNLILEIKSADILIDVIYEK